LGLFGAISANASILAVVDRHLEKEEKNVNFYVDIDWLMVRPII
jgi:hypothetical protein